MVGIDVYQQFNEVNREREYKWAEEGAGQQRFNILQTFQT